MRPIKLMLAALAAPALIVAAVLFVGSTPPTDADGIRPAAGAVVLSCETSSHRGCDQAAVDDDLGQAEARDRGEAEEENGAERDEAEPEDGALDALEHEMEPEHDAEEDEAGDIPGPCDEAEHADDPRCDGEVTEIDNSGPGRGEDRSGDGENSGSGGGEDRSGDGDEESGGDD